MHSVAVPEQGGPETGQGGLERKEREYLDSAVTVQVCHGAVRQVLTYLSVFSHDHNQDAQFLDENVFRAVIF